MITAWLIQNKQNSNLFWSENEGWVYVKPDCFSDWHKRTMQLPLHGAWVEVVIQGG